MSDYDNVTDRLSNPDYSSSRHRTRFLNPQGYAICSGAILRRLVERLMADNQRESAIEQRHRPPPVSKNRRKFLGSHLCAGIMIMRTNHVH